MRAAKGEELKNKEIILLNEHLENVRQEKDTYSKQIAEHQEKIGEQNKKKVANLKN